MSEVDVAAIRAALAKATPGPWEGLGLLLGDDGEVCVGEAERSMDAELIVLLRNNGEALLDELAEERLALTQALWDAYSALGFDTDGDPTPAALVSGMGLKGFARMVVDAAAEHCCDSEERSGGQSVCYAERVRARNV